MVLTRIHDLGFEIESFRPSKLRGLDALFSILGPLNATDPGGVLVLHTSQLLLHHLLTWRPHPPFSSLLQKN